MKKNIRTILYVIIIGGFSVFMYWIGVFGSQLEKGRNIVVAATDKSHWQNFLDSMLHNLEHPLALLLAQIVTIIFVSRFFGWICRKIGQPSVIGEIIAGIVLGPSLVAMYFPVFSNALFPAQSLGNLQFLSQFGLILFMFVIGMELDLKVLRKKAYDSVVISHASIVFPFSLGMGLAYLIYPSFAPEGVRFLSFSLFLGIAMSITAFPVLARIVQERGLQKTRLGTIVITCAAADDITAWCLLAAVIAIVKAGSFTSALFVIGLASAYVLLMLYVVKPFLKRVGDLHATRGTLSKPIVAIFLLTLIISSYATEVIGIHALFGAFMAGAIMPENSRFRSIFIEKVEDVALVLLLPLFFVFTGLRTEIGLLSELYLWKVTVLIILVAVIGKFLGSALSAKLVGQNWKDSLTIGALMNTRGLMELVVLNIGYDLGVLSPEIFAMMVIMALVTTVMTAPSLDLINWLFKDSTDQDFNKRIGFNKYNILVSFGSPENGKSLLRLASSLAKASNDHGAITAMHLASSAEIHHLNADEDEALSFTPVIDESKKLNQKITTLYKVSNDIDGDIAEVANKGGFDLLLVGVGQSIYDGSLLGKILGFTTKIINPENLISQVKGRESLFQSSPFDDRTRSILGKSDITVGILVDKGLVTIRQVLLIIFDQDDEFLLTFTKRLINSADAHLMVFDGEGYASKREQLNHALTELVQYYPDNVGMLNDFAFVAEGLGAFDLMIVSAPGWKKLIERKSKWLADAPSTLIISDRS